MTSFQVFFIAIDCIIENSTGTSVDKQTFPSSECCLSQLGGWPSLSPRIIFSFKKLWIFHGVHQFAPFLLNLPRTLVKNQWNEDIAQKDYILDKLSTPTLLSKINSSSRRLYSLCNTMDQSTFCEPNQTKWTWQK